MAVNIPREGHCPEEDEVDDGTGDGQDEIQREEIDVFLDIFHRAVGGTESVGHRERGVESASPSSAAVLSYSAHRRT